MSKPYWMIERIINGQAHWWCSNNGKNGRCDSSLRWTTEAHKARHFTEKFEADLVIDGGLIDCEATEHVDCNGPDFKEQE